jgi:hypothetical protein
MFFKNKAEKSDSTHKFSLNYKEMILPSVMIAYGVYEEFIEVKGSENDFFYHEINEHIKTKTTVDDYIQFFPSIMGFGLELTNLNSKNSLKNKFFYYSLSAIIMGITVNSLKYSTQINRPDKSAKNSFPSGHTAFAFMGAEFMRQEYWDSSKLLVISSYLFATATGYLRMHNNKHWLSDVVAGAGIGILSTQLGYFLYPKLKDLFFSEQESTIHISNLSPVINNRCNGLSISIKF